MGKAIKNVYRIFVIALDLLLLLFYALSFILQLPYFQTKIAQQATAYLSSELGSDITLSRVRIDFFQRATIQDIYVSDLKRDKLVSADELDLSIDPLALLNFQIKLQNICLVEPEIILYKDSVSNEFNFDYLIHYFSPPENDTTETIINLSLDHLEIIKGRFKFDNFSKVEKEPGFDYNHLNVFNLDLFLSDLLIDSNAISAYDCTISFKEKELNVQDFGGDIVVNEKLISINNFHYKSDFSEVFGHFALSTESWKDYENFNEKVSFKARFLPSDISMVDLTYFIPEFTGLNEIPHFSGSFSGKVNNIKGKEVQIALANHSFANLDFKLKGLPNVENTYFHLNIKELKSSKNGLEKIKIPPFDKDNFIQLPKNIATLGQIQFKGKLSGFLNDLAIEGRIQTKIGEIETDINLQNDKDFSYTGRVRAKDFDAGTFFDVQNVLGKVTLTANVKGKGLEKGKVDASIDGVIQSMEFNKYNYKNVQIAGNFKKEKFQGNIKVNDPFIKLNFVGSVDLTNNRKDFNFMAQIDDLYPRIVFGIDHLDSSAHISTTVNIDIEAQNIDSLLGRLEMMGTHFVDKDIELSSESLIFTSKRTGNTKEISVVSDVIDFNLSGKFDLMDGFKTFKKLTNVYFSNLIDEEVNLDKDFKFNMLVKDYSLIETFISPGVFFDSLTSVNGSFRSVDNYLNAQANILGFSYGLIKVDSCRINLKSEDNKLSLNSLISHYSLGGKSQNRTIDISATAADNTINASLNSYGDGPFSSDLSFQSYVFDKNTFDIKFQNSHFAINEKKWTIPDSNYIFYDSTSWSFKNVAATHDRQRVAVNGILSKNPKERLVLSLNRFDMSIINPFVDSTKLNFEGVLDGYSVVRDPYNNLLFESNLAFKDLAFNFKKLGTGHIKSNWDDIEKQFNVNGSLRLNDKNKMALNGYYRSKDEVSPLHFDLNLSELPLTVLEPFTENILSDFIGNGSGAFQLRGSLNDPKLNGTFYIKDAGLHVDYTNVSYTLRDKENKSTTIPVKFTPDSISIEAFTAVDANGGSGKGSVHFIHNGFKFFDTDLKINVSDMLFLNTNVKQNELFYGEAIVSGDISIHSQKGYTKIGMDIATENGTRFNLPIDETSEVIENKFIVFEEKETDDTKVEKKAEEEPLNLELDMHLYATPGALVRIVFDEIEGDVIETRGSGNINLKYDPKNDLSMFGEYSILSGTYVFTLQSVVSKKFNIEPGSRIKWKGDPYAGDLEIVTSYKTKARLYDILPEIDPDVNYKRRIPVDVRLNMSETIESPIIDFDVYLPDAKENVRSQLKTELSSESCMNQQVFSLLILGAFTPCESAQQNTASTNVGKNTAYEAMSNQLSGWLSQISEEVDIGFSYRPEIQGEEYSPEQVEVAISYQLLNDRLIVDYNGSSGNQTNTSSTSTSWANELRVEYKIKEDGKLRVQAFNKVNDRSYIENDNLYIQGVGFKIGKDFGSPLPYHIRRELKEREKKKKKEEQENIEDPIDEFNRQEDSDL